MDFTVHCLRLLLPVLWLSDHQAPTLQSVELASIPLSRRMEDFKNGINSFRAWRSVQKGKE